MAIVAECPACGKRFKADQSMMGRKAKCSQCGHVFSIGTAAPTASTPAAPIQPSPAPDKPVTTTPKAPGTLPPVAPRAGNKPASNAGKTASGAAKIASPAAVSGRSGTASAGASAKSATSAKPVQPATTVSPATPAISARHPGVAPTTTAPPEPAHPGVIAASPAAALAAVAPPDRDLLVDSSAATEEVDQSSAVATADAPEFDQPPSASSRPQRAGARRGSKLHKRVALVAVLLIAAGAGYVLVPRLLKPTEPSTGIRPDRDHDHSNSPGVVTLVMPADLAAAPPVWSVAPDAGTGVMNLVPGFRMVVPVEEAQHFAANQIVLPAEGKPVVAIPAWPGTERTGPETVSVFDLVKQSRLARFKLTQHLAYPILSADGAYYAGHVWDEEQKVARVEVWSTARAQQVYSLSVPAPTVPNFGLAVGFPAPAQVMILGDKLRVVDLASQSIQRELSLPAWSEETRATASPRLKLVAIADYRSLYLVDVSAGVVHGPMPINDAVLSHPRKRLSLRAMDFSPDGKELALAFDNRLAARRIVIVDVASGRMIAQHFPAAPVYSGGPDLQWFDDAKALLVGSGIVLDRFTARQIGQVYSDTADEGLGGQVVTLASENRALVAWDKHPRSLVLRAESIQREKPEWVHVRIESATPSLYETLDCVGAEFGNSIPLRMPVMLQRGRLTDGGKFLAVDLTFTAGLTPHAPEGVMFRQDQFTLLADGLPRSPVGTLNAPGLLSLEKPAYRLRRDDTHARARTIVFAVTGREKSLVLQVGNAQRVLGAPTRTAPPAVSEMGMPPADRLNSALFAAANDTSAFEVRVTGNRLGAMEINPDAADDIPLRVTYSSPDAWLLAINFDLTANAARTAVRGARATAPTIGLLLPDGTHLRALIELPGPLPIMITPGERYTHTSLFVLRTDPAKVRTYRLTCDGVPVATINPDSSAGRVP